MQIMGEKIKPEPEYFFYVTNGEKAVLDCNIFK